VTHKPLPHKGAPCGPQLFHHPLSPALNPSPPQGGPAHSVAENRRDLAAVPGVCRRVQGGAGPVVHPPNAHGAVSVQPVLFWPVLRAARHHSAYFLPVADFPPIVPVGRRHVAAVDLFHDHSNRARLHDCALDQHRCHVLSHGAQRFCRTGTVNV